MENSDWDKVTAQTLKKNLIRIITILFFLILGYVTYWGFWANFYWIKNPELSQMEILQLMIAKVFCWE